MQRYIDSRLRNILPEKGATKTLEVWAERAQEAANHKMDGHGNRNSNCGQSQYCQDQKRDGVVFTVMSKNHYICMQSQVSCWSKEVPQCS